MQALRFTLVICAIAGCWRPFSWTSSRRCTMYSIYKVSLVSLLCSFNVTQFIYIVLNFNNSNEVTETMYMMLTVFVAFYKIISMWVNRKSVTAIVNALVEKSFVPSSSGEMTIRRKYDKIVQSAALWYLILVMTTVLCIILTSLFMEFTRGNLTYRAWLPFDYTAPVVFNIVYAHQLIGMAICATVNVACDNLICGLLSHICCQLEMLEHRLMKISHSRHALRDCVDHHDRIFQYAYVVNSQFAKIIALQFAVSMLVVCSSLYKLAMNAINANVLPLILYTACILAQIFIYCWFGNEVKIKSLHLSNGIYNMNWPTLNNSNKRSLLIIMKRSANPIEFTSAVIITMNLDSFVSVLKASYSAFNLLKHT